MQTVRHAGMEIRVDDDGFLVEFDDWNEKVAAALAEREEIGVLTSDKMAILKFMREFYRVHKFFPILRAVCKNVHQPKECVTEEFIEPVKAWKIAGLPNPGPEVNIFKTWEPLGF